MLLKDFKKTDKYLNSELTIFLDTDGEEIFDVMDNVNIVRIYRIINCLAIIVDK